ncbi:hypothetical protein Fot_54061 [Forsythia ovata]|uniref:Uncharacterized protein n=1 Tax=Forsythia ovata TaxID=205694 RepID=A0ABD1PGN7_9LAMI
MRDQAQIQSRRSPDMRNRAAHLVGYVLGCVDRQHGSTRTARRTITQIRWFSPMVVALRLDIASSTFRLRSSSNQGSIVNAMGDGGKSDWRSHCRTILLSGNHYRIPNRICGDVLCQSD